MKLDIISCGLVVKTTFGIQIDVGSNPSIVMLVLVVIVLPAGPGPTGPTLASPGPTRCWQSP